MKVSQLQALLKGVVEFVKNSGAGQKLISDLEQSVQCLEPFALRTVDEWSQFLQAAEKYHRDGTIPCPVPTGPAKRGSTSSPLKKST